MKPFITIFFAAGLILAVLSMGEANLAEPAPTLSLLFMMAACFLSLVEWRGLRRQLEKEQKKLVHVIIEQSDEGIEDVYASVPVSVELQDLWQEDPWDPDTLRSDRFVFSARPIGEYVRKADNWRGK